jgi:flagellar biosynthesis protein FlhB
VLERVLGAVHVSGDATIVVVNPSNGSIGLGYVEESMKSIIILQKRPKYLEDLERIVAKLL